MDKKELKHIIHSIFKKLNKHAKQMRQDGDEEAIHLFRTDIKKLRAFLRLLSLQTEDDKKMKLPAALKKMYTSAGIIRDAQLKRQRLHSMLHLGKQHTEILILSSEQLAALQQDFLSAKELKAAEASLDKHLPEILFNATVQSFFYQKQFGIKSIMDAGLYRDEQLHEVRKQLKDLLYIIKIDEDTGTTLPFSFWNKEELIFAEKLAHELGLFNDAVVMLGFLQAEDCKQSMAPEEWQEAHDKSLAEKETLKKKILALLPALKMISPDKYSATGI